MMKQSHVATKATKCNKHMVFHVVGWVYDCVCFPGVGSYPSSSSPVEEGKVMVPEHVISDSQP